MNAVERGVSKVEEERVQALAGLVSLGRQLLQAARSSNPEPDWLQLLRNEAKLRAQLETLMGKPVLPHEVEAVRIALQELLAINADLVDLIDGYRARAVQALEHKALVRRAARAYSHSAVG